MKHSSMQAYVRPAPVLTATLALLALTASQAPAQSGRATMHGYVGFEGIAYVDVPKSPRAKVELRATSAGNRGTLTVETDDHGSYDFKTVSPGEYALQISAPGFKTYKTEIYLPSDFQCSLATLLKKTDGKKAPAKE